MPGLCYIDLKIKHSKSGSYVSGLRLIRFSGRSGTDGSGQSDKVYIYIYIYI